MMEEEVLFLSEDLARNYEALQRFLNNDPLPGPFRRSHTKREIKNKLVEKQGGYCLDCGMTFVKDGNDVYATATRDHIIPIKYGATLRLNQEWVCRPCNIKRDENRMYHILRFFGTIK